MWLISYLENNEMAMKASTKYNVINYVNVNISVIVMAQRISLQRNEMAGVMA